MKNNPHISFEFFAAKTPEGREKLKTTCRELDKFNPEFYSVTYGAGGSTRDTTKDIVLDIRPTAMQPRPISPWAATVRLMLSNWCSPIKRRVSINW